MFQSYTYALLSDDIKEGVLLHLLFGTGTHQVVLAGLELTVYTR